MTSIALTEAQARFLQGGVTIVVSSRDRRRVPSLSRALACRVESDGQLQVLLVRSQSQQLLSDIVESRRVALVFCQPSTHETYQIKSDDVSIVPVTKWARTAAQAHAQAFADDIVPLGFSRAFALALHSATEDDYVVIQLSPQVLFEQTPGPHAGERIAP